MVEELHYVSFRLKYFKTRIISSINIGMYMIIGADFRNRYSNYLRIIGRFVMSAHLVSSVSDCRYMIRIHLQEKGKRNVIYTKYYKKNFMMNLLEKVKKQKLAFGW